MRRLEHLARRPVAQCLVQADIVVKDQPHADAAAGLDGWERLEDVRSKVVLVVVNRPGTTIDPTGPSSPLKGWDYRMVEVPALEISSTDLRDRVVSGRPLDFLVPMAAIRVIREHGLYPVTR